MWLLRRCRWSWITLIVYNGFGCARTIYCYWNILQRAGGYNGWSKDLATALSYTGKKNANKGKSESFIASLCFYYSSAWLVCVERNWIPGIVLLSLFHENKKLSRRWFLVSSLMGNFRLEQYLIPLKLKRSSTSKDGKCGSWQYSMENSIWNTPLYGAKPFKNHVLV